MHQLVGLLPIEWGIHAGISKITICHISGTIPAIDKTIIIDSKGDLKLRIKNICRTPDFLPGTLEELVTLIKSVHSIKVCNGSCVDGKVSSFCTGENTQMKSERCRACALIRKKNCKNPKKATQPIVKQERKRKRYSYLLTKQVKQSQKIRDLQKCAKLKSAMGTVPNMALLRGYLKTRNWQ